MWKIQGIIIAIDGQNVRYYWIPNFGDAYVIGDDGSLWTRHKKVGVNWILSDDWTRMNPTPKELGYLYVNLCFNGRVYTRKIHKLVCEAEYGPCPAGLEACHNDGNLANNNWWNLRYDTPVGNSADKVIHGTDNSGERNPNAKLNWTKAREIRVKYVTGKYTLDSLALEYGVANVTIQAIVYNRIWVEEYDFVT